MKKTEFWKQSKNILMKVSENGVVLSVESIEFSDSRVPLDFVNSDKDYTMVLEGEDKVEDSFKEAEEEEKVIVSSLKADTPESNKAFEEDYFTSTVNTESVVKEETKEVTEMPTKVKSSQVVDELKIPIKFDGKIKEVEPIALMDSILEYVGLGPAASGSLKDVFEEILNAKNEETRVDSLKKAEKSLEHILKLLEV